MMRRSGSCAWLVMWSVRDVRSSPGVEVGSGAMAVHPQLALQAGLERLPRAVQHQVHPGVGAAVAGGDVLDALLLQVVRAHDVGDLLAQAVQAGVELVAQALVGEGRHLVAVVEGLFQPLVAAQAVLEGALRQPAPPLVERLVARDGGDPRHEGGAELVLVEAEERHHQGLLHHVVHRAALRQDGRHDQPQVRLAGGDDLAEGLAVAGADAGDGLVDLVVLGGSGHGVLGRPGGVLKEGFLRRYVSAGAILSCVPGDAGQGARIRRAVDGRTALPGRSVAESRSGGVHISLVSPGTAMPLRPLLAIAVVAATGAIAADGSGTVDFHRDIDPIFRASCYTCHGPDKQEGGLRMDSRAALLTGGDDGPGMVVGDGARSGIVLRSLGEGDGARMPKKKAPLAREEIALITRWIDQGAPWPAGAGSDARHWAYVPPKD